VTNFPEDTILYFTNFGPIRYIDDDNNTVGFLDRQGVLKAAEEGTAKTLRQHKQHSQPCPHWPDRAIGRRSDCDIGTGLKIA
jgi:hypothetical protein